MSSKDSERTERARFCPQCGQRTAFSSCASREQRVIDAEGFCVSRSKVRPRASVGGCHEHLVRFDAETGARLAVVDVRHVRAWAGA